MWTDGQTDISDISFRSFVNVPKDVTTSFNYKSDRANFNFIQMKPYRILFYIKDTHGNPTKLSR
jgi:hypothetical protein